MEDQSAGMTNQTIRQRVPQKVIELMEQVLLSSVMLKDAKKMLTVWYDELTEEQKTEVIQATQQRLKDVDKVTKALYKQLALISKQHRIRKEKLGEAQRSL